MDPGSGMRKNSGIRCKGGAAEKSDLPSKQKYELGTECRHTQRDVPARLGSILLHDLKVPQVVSGWA